MKSVVFPENFAKPRMLHHMNGLNNYSRSNTKTDLILRKCMDIVMSVG